MTQDWRESRRLSVLHFLLPCKKVEEQNLGDHLITNPYKEYIEGEGSKVMNIDLVIIQPRQRLVG